MSQIPEHWRRANSARRGYEPHEALCSPSTLSTNLSVSGGSLVTSPALCSNTVSGGINISNYFVGVRQNTLPTTSKDQALAQVEDSDAFSKPTPKKVRRKPQVVFHQNKGRGLPSAGGGNVTRNRLSSEDIHLQLDRLGLEEGEKITRERLHSPGGHGLTSLTGEITGTRVTADYHCSGCSSAISSFKAKAFRVKCSRCRHSWKCAKLRCTCTAEITIELSDRSKRTVVLSDPLLRSIVGFETEGHCNTDTIEDRVLKVGSIRVDYVGGVPERVERITADRVRA